MAPHQVRDKLQPEFIKFNYFWIPDQVRHDGIGTGGFFNPADSGKHFSNVSKR